MATYRLKRFTENKENSNSSSGVGKAVGATALVAGGLLAGKKGLLGTGVSKGINKGLMNMGKSTGSSALFKSGAKDYSKAASKSVNDMAKTTGISNGASKFTQNRNAANIKSQLYKNSGFNDKTGFASNALTTT